MQYAIALFCAAIISAFIYGGGAQSLSADLAHHYALISTLFHDGGRSATAAHLGEMGIYPDLTHWIAVYAGRLSGMGPLFGMIGVSVAAVAVLYASIFALVAASGPLPALFSAAALIGAALTRANMSALFGYELVHNFLYAQIVAAALGWAALLALFLVRERARPWQRDALALAFILTLAYGHLLPALHLAATYGLILLSEIFEDRKQWPRLVPYSIIGLAGLLLHPSFATMALIANNDGALSFGFTNFPGAHTIVLCATLIVSVMVYLTGFRSLRWLACAGIAISILAGIQLIALRLGHGSAYAVKKYYFTIYTLLVAQVGSLAGASLQKMSPAKLPAAPALSAAFGVVMLALTIAPARFNNRDLERVAEFTRQFASFHRPFEAKGLVIVDSASHHPVLNYMLSLGEARLPKDSPNALALLLGQKLPKPGLIAFAIVDQADPRYPPVCTLPAPISPTYRVVDLRRC